MNSDIKKGSYKTNIKDFTKGNITKQLVCFSAPLFLANLLQIAYNMIDMVIVGHKLGKSGISAISVGGDVSALLTFLSMGFCSAGQIIIAKFVGAGQKEKIGKFVGTMAFFLFCASVSISILSIIFRHSILVLMNTPDESYKGALDYSTITMIGLVFIYGYNAVSAILRGMGDSKHPFIFIAIAAILNLILDVIFVMKLNMGCAGAAYATVISQGISFLCCTAFLIKKHNDFELNIKIKDFFNPNKEMLGELIKLGTPMAIKSASIQFSKLFVNSWINSYGVAVSAFAGIANKISSISNLVSMSMNTAGSTLVGQNIAAAKFDRVNKILVRLTIITVTIALLFSAVICFFPNQIFGLFTTKSDTDVLALSGKYIPIAVLLFFAGAGRAIMNALINGSGNYKINFVTAILDGIVMRIGLALLFGLALNMKHYGFWLGDALAGFTPFLVGFIYYLTGQWKNGAIIISKEPSTEKMQ